MFRWLAIAFSLHYDFFAAFELTLSQRNPFQMPKATIEALRHWQIMMVSLVRCSSSNMGRIRRIRSPIDSQRRYLLSCTIRITGIRGPKRSIVAKLIMTPWQKKLFKGNGVKFQCSYKTTPIPPQSMRPYIVRIKGLLKRSAHR